MTTEATTIGTVASELVSRGLPKYDHDPADRDWHGPDQCWWIHHPAEGPPRPQTVLGILGHSNDHEWQFAICSCACCENVARTELVDEDGYTIAVLPFWPGLKGAIRMHRHASVLWEAELQRFVEGSTDG